MHVSFNVNKKKTKKNNPDIKFTAHDAFLENLRQVRSKWKD